MESQVRRRLRRGREAPSSTPPKPPRLPFQLPEISISKGGKKKKASKHDVGGTFGGETFSRNVPNDGGASGWLLRKGSIGKPQGLRNIAKTSLKWSRAYFVLDGSINMLAIYKTEGSAKASELFNLLGARASPSSEERLNASSSIHPFIIRARNREMIIGSSNEEMSRKWLYAVRDSIRKSTRKKLGLGTSAGSTFIAKSKRWGDLSSGDTLQMKEISPSERTVLVPTFDPGMLAAAPDRTKSRPMSRARDFGIDQLLRECNIHFIQENTSSKSTPVLWTMRSGSDKKYASVRIQALWRGACARSLYQPILSTRMKEKSRLARKRLREEKRRNRVSDHVLRLVLYAPTYSTKFALVIESAARSFLVRLRLYYLNQRARVVQHIWEKYQRKRYRAICFVQTIARGVLGRRAAVKRRQLLWIASESYVYSTFQSAHRSIRCATLIQGLWRSSAAGKKYARRKQSALKMQAFGRMLKCKVEYRKKRRAATKLQSAFRMKCARIALTQAKKTVTLLASAYRMQIARRAFVKSKWAVTKLAALWIGRREKKSFVRMKKAAQYLQSHFRGFWQLKQFQVAKRAAVCMQAVSRSMATRANYLRTKSCAIRLQAVLRSNQQQKIYKESLGAVVRIQCAFRRAIAGKRFTELKGERDATVLLQNIWRACKCRRWWKLMRKRRKRAATMTQAAFRGAKVRSDWRASIARTCRTYVDSSRACLLKAGMRYGRTCVLVRADVIEDAVIIVGVLARNPVDRFTLLLSGKDLSKLFASGIFPRPCMSFREIANHLARNLSLTPCHSRKSNETPPQRNPRISRLKCYFSGFYVHFSQDVLNIASPEPARRSVIQDCTVALMTATTLRLSKMRRITEDAAFKRWKTSDHRLNNSLWHVFCTNALHAIDCTEEESDEFSSIAWPSGLSKTFSADLQFCIDALRFRQTGYPLYLFSLLRRAAYRMQNGAPLRSLCKADFSVERSEYSQNSLLSTIHSIEDDSDKRLSCLSSKIKEWEDTMRMLSERIHSLEADIHREGDIVVEIKMNQGESTSLAGQEYDAAKRALTDKQGAEEDLLSRKVSGRFDAFDETRLAMTRLQIKVLEIDVDIKGKEKMMHGRLYASMEKQQSDLEEAGVCLERLQSALVNDISSWSQGRALVYVKSEYATLTSLLRVVNRIRVFAERRIRLRMQLYGSFSCRYARWRSGKKRRISARENEMCHETSVKWGHREIQHEIDSTENSCLRMWSDALIWKRMWDERISLRAVRVAKGELSILKDHVSQLEASKATLAVAGTRNDERMKEIRADFEKEKAKRLLLRTKLEDDTKKLLQQLDALRDEPSNYWWFEYVATMSLSSSEYCRHACDQHAGRLFLNKEAESKFLPPKKDDGVVYVTQTQIFRARVRAKYQEMGMGIVQWRKKYEEKWDSFYRKMQHNTFVRRNILMRWEDFLYAVEENKVAQAIGRGYKGVKRSAGNVVKKGKNSLVRTRQLCSDVKEAATPAFIKRRRINSAAFKIQRMYRKKRSWDTAKLVLKDCVQRNRVLVAANRIQSLYHNMQIPGIIQNLLRVQYDKVYDVEVCAHFYYNTVNGSSSWDPPAVMRRMPNFDLDVSAKGMYSNPQVLENIRPPVGLL